MPDDKKWPIRWDLLLRYRLIEIVALWESRLTTNHLCDAFGIGRQQASKDINTYLEDIAPGNLKYDKHLKGYKPSLSFSPKVTLGFADEYLHLLNRNTDLAKTFDQLPLGISNTEVINVPVRNIEPGIIRAIVSAARQQKRLDVDYVSVNMATMSVQFVDPKQVRLSAFGLAAFIRAPEGKGIAVIF